MSFCEYPSFDYSTPFPASAKTPVQKNANPAKKDGVKNQPSFQNGGTKIATEVEKHANKVAALPGSKLSEPKVRVSALKETKPIAHQPAGNGTGIPKPTLAVKGNFLPFFQDQWPVFRCFKEPPNPVPHRACAPKKAHYLRNLRNILSPVPNQQLQWFPP